MTVFTLKNGTGAGHPSCPRKGIKLCKIFRSLDAH